MEPNIIFYIIIITKYFTCIVEYIQYTIAVLLSIFQEYIESVAETFLKKKIGAAATSRLEVRVE